MAREEKRRRRGDERLRRHREVRNGAKRLGKEDSESENREEVGES